MLESMICLGVVVIAAVWIVLEEVKLKQCRQRIGDYQDKVVRLEYEAEQKGDTYQETFDEQWCLDQTAISALNGLLANDITLKKSDETNDQFRQRLCVNSYLWARAMLAERKKTI